MLKALIWILAIGAALCALAYYFLWLPQDASEMPQPVQLKTIHRSAHGTGLVEGNSAITRLKFAFAGAVDEIGPKENSTIEQGDMVAKLNSTEIDDKIAREEITLKEAKAKRDAIAARRNVDEIEKKQEELKRARSASMDAGLHLTTLLAPAAAAARLEQQEDARLGLEHAQRALNLAESEQKQLLSHPTVHELEAADARLSVAKFRNDEAKRTGQGAEAAAAELRYALADYDKIKQGASREDKDVASARAAQARTELDRAEAEKRRIDKPQTPPIIAPSEIEAAQKALLDAQGTEKQKRLELDALRRDGDSAETRVADAGVERCEQDLKSLKKMKLGYELHAPFKALVVKRLVEPDALLAPFEDVLWIVDFTHKRVRAEFDIEKLPWLIRPELKAAIKSRAFGKEELTARVVEIGKVSARKLLQDDPSQPKGGEVVEVVMEFDPPSGELKKSLYELLRPGLRVEADIVLESRANVISVPKSYIATDNGENGIDTLYVMKVDANSKKQKNDAAHKQVVTCGLRDEYYVEILSGLSVDDLVVKPKAQGK